MALWWALDLGQRLFLQSILRAYFFNFSKFLQSRYLIMVKISSLSSQRSFGSAERTKGIPNGCSQKVIKAHQNLCLITTRVADNHYIYIKKPLSCISILLLSLQWQRSPHLHLYCIPTAVISPPPDIQTVLVP